MCHICGKTTKKGLKMVNQADLQKIVDAKQAIYDSLFQQTKVALDDLGVAKMNLASYLAMPRITVALINDAGLSNVTMAIYARVLQFAIDDAKSKGWVLPPVSVVIGAAKGAWEVAITTEARREGADGWHNIGPTGLAYAYVLPGTGAYPFGTWRPAKPDRTIGKTFFPAEAEYLRSGCLTVLVHETLEMLVDPALKTVSKTPDKAGHNWLVEVCSSSAFGFYWHYQDPISKQDCVMPNFAYPSAFDMNGKAPFDKCGVLKFPFDHTAKSYPYWVDPASGNLFKV
jgi:hypothetical protein